MNHEEKQPDPLRMLMRLRRRVAASTSEVISVSEREQSMLKKLVGEALQSGEEMPDEVRESAKRLGLL